MWVIKKKDENLFLNKQGRRLLQLRDLEKATTYTSEVAAKYSLSVLRRDFHVFRYTEKFNQYQFEIREVEIVLKPPRKDG